MKITKQDGNVTHLVSNEQVYCITKHSCPECACVLFTCSCPNFQMGIARKGGNPFVDGCKHIQFYREETNGQTFDISPQESPDYVPPNPIDMIDGSKGSKARQIKRRLKNA